MNFRQIILHKSVLKFLSPIIKPFLNEHDKLVLYWKSHDLNNTLRLNYPLNENSLVFDLGGYLGEWSNDIFTKYSCNIYIFEPVPEYFNLIKDRCKEEKKIKVYNFGLSNVNKYTRLNIDQDSTSEFTLSNHKTIKIKLVSFAEFLAKKEITDIDLIKINIEGGEYDLLESMIENHLAGKIENIQIQFHDFVPNAKLRMSKIQKNLSKTHKLTYQYKFLWENWQLK